LFGISFAVFFLSPVYDLIAARPMEANSLRLKPFEMKTMALLIGIAFTYGCTAEKEVQMDMIDVKLVRIETVQRYPDLTQKILTWTDRNNVSYVTFEPVHVNYKIGSYMKVMVRK
jgi:hypothetical protein